MNYIIGASLFAFGLAIAFSASRNFTAAGISLFAVLAIWILAGFYYAGVHGGKRNNDL